MRGLLCALCLLSAPAWAQSLAVSQTTVQPGATITVQVSAGPAHVFDWVAIFPVGIVPNGNYLHWQFLTGTQSPPAAGLTSASLQVPMPHVPGSYILRWLASGGYTEIASQIITVTGEAIPLLLVNGDSNTSYDYAPAATNWANAVAAGFGLPLENMAVSGKYSDGVLLDLPAMQARQAAICLVMIGTNDMAAAVQHGTAGALSAYLGRMREIVTGLKIACGKVIVLTPIFTLHPLEVARFESWVLGLRELTTELQVKLIDVWGHMRALAAVKPSAQFDAYYLVPGVDRHHLSAAGHAVLAAYVLEQSR